MCGIVSITNFNGVPVNKLVKQTFENQRGRGTDGFGLFDHEFGNLVRSTGEKRIRKWLDRYPSRSILFHHRLPTSTDNVHNACHPFSTGQHFKTNYVMVHNGSIHNDYELHEAHAKLDIKYYSEQPDGGFNDSEALLWDVALYLEGKQTELKVKGNVAFVCLAVGKGNKHDRLYFARNTNPLNMLLNENLLMLSSEGEGEPIDPYTLYEYDYVNGKLKTKELAIPTYTYTQTDWSYHAPDETLNRWGAYNEPTDLWKYQREVLYEDLNTPPEDIENTIDKFMWAADGYYTDAVFKIDTVVDGLFELAKATNEFRRKQDIDYTINILIEASEQISDNKAYKDTNSRDEQYTYSELDEDYELIERGE